MFLVLIVAAFELIAPLLDDRLCTIINDCAQLGAGGFAAVAALAGGIRSSGWQRLWRFLTAIGMLGWTVGQALWSWHQIFERTAIPSPSLADLGYLSMVPFVLGALVVFAAHGTSPHTAHPNPRQVLVLILDGFLIVSSLFLLTWTTALGYTVRTAQPNAAGFAVAVTYPITDLALVAIVLLIYTTRKVARAHLRQLGQLAFGLTALVLSDTAFAYVVATGAAHVPPIADVGFILGPVFVGLSAFSATPAVVRPKSHGARQSARPMALFVPYAPLVLATLMLAVQSAYGKRPDAIEIVAASAMFALVLVRQSTELVIAAHVPAAEIAPPVAAPPTAGVDGPPRIPQQAPAPPQGLSRASSVVVQADREQTPAIVDVAVLRDLNNQLDSLRRASIRATVWTFIGGLILGTLGNVIVALLVR